MKSVEQVTFGKWYYFVVYGSNAKQENRIAQLTGIAMDNPGGFVHTRYEFDNGRLVYECPPWLGIEFRVELEAWEVANLEIKPDDQPVEPLGGVS